MRTYPYSISACEVAGVAAARRGYRVSGVYNNTMAPSGIPSARKKLGRAQVHADALRVDVDAFRKQSPYEFEMEPLGNSRGRADIRVIAKVTRATPIPDSWALIMGDILTNVRAALDHAVYPHVRANAPDVQRWQIQYPIADSAAEFEAKTAKTEGWFTKDVHRVIEQWQPYHADDPSGHPLRILQKLVNIDKHRSLLVADYPVVGFGMPTHELYETASPTEFFRVKMVAGAVVACLHLRLVKGVHGDHPMQVPGKFLPLATIEIEGIEERVPLLAAIDRIMKIGRHLEALEEAGC